MIDQTESPQVGDTPVAGQVRAIRPTQIGDAPQLAGLLTEAGLSTNIRPEDLDWKYWQEHEEWKSPRSYALVRDGQLLAHAGIIPGACVWPRGRLKTIHLIDWAARPGAGGAGVTLMKYIARSVDALLAIGGSAQTLQILPHIGFQPVGSATQYVRPLRPLRIFRGGPGPRWKRLPRALRSALWRLRAPRPRINPSRIYTIEENQVNSLTGVFPLANDDMAVFERTAAMLRHALRCPIATMKLFGWERGGQLRGYFLLASAPAQVRLVDYWTPSRNPEDWRDLLIGAIDHAYSYPDAAELVTWGSGELRAQSLQLSGFRARGVQQVRLYRHKDRQLPDLDICVQMLDNDAAYYNNGRIELWA